MAYFYVEYTGGATMQDGFDAAKAANAVMANKTTFTSGGTPFGSPELQAAYKYDQNWRHVAEASGPAGGYDLVGDKWAFFGDDGA